jgi:hypothetical protein
MPDSEAKGGPEIRRRQAIAAGCWGPDAALAGRSQGRQSLSFVHKRLRAPRFERLRQRATWVDSWAAKSEF